MVILVDGAAHGAEGVVTVGHGIGDGEFLQPGSLGRLDDADKGDVVGNERVELDAHLLGIVAHIVSAQDGIGDGLFPGLVGGCHALGLIRVDDLAVYQIRAFFDDFYHGGILLHVSLYQIKNGVVR